MEFHNEQIDIDSLPTIEKIEMIPIEKDYYKVLLLNSLLSYFFLFVITFVGRLFYRGTNWSLFFPFILVLLCIGIAIHFIGTKKGFSKRKYGLRNFDISYTEGWLYTQFYTVPFVRTQHVEIKQSFISKHFGLANLKVFTAGAGDDVYIKGLNAEKAEEIRTFIISKINGEV